MLDTHILIILYAKQLSISVKILYSKKAMTRRKLATAKTTESRGSWKPVFLQQVLLTL